MPSRTSDPDPIPAPEPGSKKHPRIWLAAPYLLLLVLALGWAGWWFMARVWLERGLDSRAEALRGAGYVVEMEGRHIEGFPFRMKLGFTSARIVTPSGWALSIPGLAGEAYLHQIDHWVLVAPQGLTVTRPLGGPIEVKGGPMRASIAGTSQNPWRIVLSGEKLVFTPAAGARPFSLASADRLEFYTKPLQGSADGAALVRLEGGRATPETVLYRLTGEGPVTATFNARLTHPEAFHGKDWGDAVRTWTKAGGVVSQVEGQLAGKTASAKTKDGTLGAGSDGRLVGAIPLQLHQAAPALAALGEAKALEPDVASSAAAVAAARAQGQDSNLNLVFQAGVTTLGPVRIGPSPKVG